MKRCSNCNQSFSDDNVFCLNDGTVLETTSGASYSGDLPTRFITPFPAVKTIEKKDSNTNIYAVIGAMAIVIVGLSAIVFFLMSDAKDKKNEENNSSVAAQTSPTSEKGNKTPKVEKTPAPVLEITTEAAQNLVNSWEKAQDGKNFNAYRACYSSQQFLGIKRTNEGEREQKTYAQWMADRQKMLKNTIDVEIKDSQITIEDDTAIVQFVQKFNSVNYCDEGSKVLRIKMFSDGAKIIYEEMKSSQICLN